MNNLREELRNEPNINKFKKGLKDWVKDNISVKPKTTFPSLFTPLPPRPPPPPPPQPPKYHHNTGSTWDPRVRS